MCHHIEDPTFDATVQAINPRAKCRPVHRPPRAPADREPHCRWEVVIDDSIPDSELPTEAFITKITGDTTAGTFEFGPIQIKRCLARIGAQPRGNGRGRSGGPIRDRSRTNQSAHRADPALNMRAHLGVDARGARHREECHAARIWRTGPGPRGMGLDKKHYAS
jgi:hypothetical protein